MLDSFNVIDDQTHDDDKKDMWVKDSMKINETIILPRQSMHAIVMFFRHESPSDREKLCSRKKKFKVTIKGIPNSFYS